MRLLKAYRFRLEPTPVMAREMSRVAGCCRFVFNRALALQRERFESKEKHLGYAALCKELTSWRHTPETAFLAEAPTHPLQQALKDLERAYRNFFEGRPTCRGSRRRAGTTPSGSRTPSSSPWTTGTAE